MSLLAPAGLRDGMRTLSAVGVTVAPMFARLLLHRLRPQESTTTAEGLARAADACRRGIAAFGIELEVLEAARVPSEGGLVLMWNQESHLDHLVLAASIPRAFFSLYNNEVARFPLYGNFMRTTGHVHVDREDEPQWRKAIAGAAARVARGECVLVSPEGTRSTNGVLLPMKRGAFILATQSERPIVCVTAIGGHERLPRGSMVVRPGKMRVVFSNPIETRAHTEESGELQAEVTRVFEETKRAHLPSVALVP